MLIELARRERSRGRRVWVYVTHTETRDLTPRLRAILDREGLRVAVLKAGTVTADRREESVAARVRDGVEVVISHPRLVQTGLDLLDFPSLVWYEPDYSVYTVRQASRRSWRIMWKSVGDCKQAIYLVTGTSDGFNPFLRLLHS